MCPCHRSAHCLNNTRCYACDGTRLFRPDKRYKKLRSGAPSTIKAPGWKSLEKGVANYLNRPRSTSAFELGFERFVQCPGASQAKLKVADIPYLFSFKGDERVFAVVPGHFVLQLASSGRAKVVPGSGNKWYNPGDVKTDKVLIECKDRADQEPTIMRLWLDKVQREARASNRIGILFVRFGPDMETAAVMDYEDLRYLMEVSDAETRSQEESKQDPVD